MDELEELRGQAAALGVKVDGRWGVDRLHAEIQAVQPAPVDPEQADVDELEVTNVEPVFAEGLPVHRAGGHVDRGDGRGWVIEE